MRQRRRVNTSAVSWVWGNQWLPERILPVSAGAGKAIEFSVEDHFLLEIIAHHFPYNFIWDKSTGLKTGEVRAATLRWRFSMMIKEREMDASWCSVSKVFLVIFQEKNKEEELFFFFAGCTSVIMQILFWLLNSGIRLEALTGAEAGLLCALVACLPSHDDWLLEAPWLNSAPTEIRLNR